MQHHFVKKLCKFSPQRQKHSSIQGDHLPKDLVHSPPLYSLLKASDFSAVISVDVENKQIHVIIKEILVRR